MYNEEQARYQVFFHRYHIPDSFVSGDEDSIEELRS